MRWSGARSVLVAPAALLALGVVTHAAPTMALVNESPSLPRGLYIRAAGAAPKAGDVVAVPQPPAARPYLASLGMPADVKLIKRVAAEAGDLVCAEDGAVALPGRVLRVRDRDRRGQPLPAWRGCRRLAAGEVFLVGDTPSSFDSRYFGPVRREQVVGVFREAVRW